MGDWCLEISGDLDIEVLSYIRHQDGFLISMHDLTPKMGTDYYVAIFNPASNENQLSKLRLVNTGDAVAAVRSRESTIEAGRLRPPWRLSVPARRTLTLTAQQLESGTGVQGALGDGSGKWRLLVESDQPIHVMNLLKSPTGHLTNLSTARGDVADSSE